MDTEAWTEPLLLLTTLGAYTQRCFGARATSTGWQDHVVMQAWDDQRWAEPFSKEKNTSMLLREHLGQALK